jgi:hypothetical protein
MPVQRTSIELFELAGRALTPGHDWRAALATAMGIRPDSIRQLLSGRMPLKPGHFRDLLAAIVAQRAELARVEQELREWLAQQPDKEQTRP